MSKYVRETAAGKSISAYVILKGSRKVATVQASFSNGGRVLVNVWQDGEAAERSAKAREKAGNPFKPEKYGSPAAFQHDSAGGYGYDKFTSALAGMVIDGHEMADHSSRLNAPKPPKGCTLFPRDYKAPKGYDLANFTEISKATGHRIYRDAWMVRACEALGFAPDKALSTEDHDAVYWKANEMETAWRASDDCVTGYSDCYRKDGLNYLKAIGYTVIQAI
jgi:hypothetical protein